MKLELQFLAALMGKSRKIASARERAHQISRSVPFHQLRSELDPKTQEMKLVNDGQCWPRPDEQVDEYTAVLALERANALYITGRYLRQRLTVPQPLNEFGHRARSYGQIAISARVVSRLAEMLDPSPNCPLPFVFALKQHSYEIYKLNRYREIASYCRALQAAGFHKLDSAIKKTTVDLGVSERDVYRGLRVVAGKPVKSKSRRIT